MCFQISNPGAYVAEVLTYELSTEVLWPRLDGGEQTGVHEKTLDGSVRLAELESLFVQLDVCFDNL